MSIMQVVPNLGCEINLPAALKGEALQGLPPYARTTAYDVSAFPACPENWMRADGKNGAFFLGVKKGQGLWLDFNACWAHEKDVAILISVQGINPITGTPVGDLVLEQYPDAVGGAAPQNYLATTGTPQGHLWLDGFRGADGEVRQYILSEETLRGIAAQVLGDARSYSIGVAFFLSKENKPYKAYRDRLEKGFNWNGPDYMDEVSPFAGGPFGGGLKKSGGWPKSDIVYRSLIASAEPASFLADEKPRGITSKMMMCRSVDPSENQILAEASEALDMGVYDGTQIEEEPTRLEVAAGARIRQQIYKDPKSLDYWEKSPESVLYINYTSPDTVAKIRATGRVGANSEGGLKGLKVGN